MKIHITKEWLIKKVKFEDICDALNEIRLTIAEHVGFRWQATNITTPGANFPKEMWHDLGGRPVEFLPDFPLCLNAMHRAENWLPLDQRKALRLWLYEFTDQMLAHSAPAIVRAKAFLSLVGKWKPEWEIVFAVESRDLVNLLIQHGK